MLHRETPKNWVGSPSTLRVPIRTCMWRNYLKPREKSPKRISQPQHSFRTDTSFFRGCIMGYLMTSWLFPTRYRQQQPPLLSCENQKCLQTMPNILCRAELSPAENYWPPALPLTGVVPVPTRWSTKLHDSWGIGKSTQKGPVSVVG